MIPEIDFESQNMSVMINVFRFSCKKKVKTVLLASIYFIFLEYISVLCILPKIVSFAGFQALKPT